MTKERSFRKSKIIVTEALEEKRINDEARKLNQDYKLNIEALKQAREVVFQFANKHLLELDIDKTIEEIRSRHSRKNEILEDIESSLTSIHDIYDLNTMFHDRETSLSYIETCFSYLKTEQMLSLTREISHLKPRDSIAPYIEKIQSSITSLEPANNNRLEFEKEIGLTEAQLFELYSAIEKFLDIYDKILNMDPREYKEESYHEYFKTFKKNIETEEFAEAEDSGVYTGLDILSSFKSIIPSFSNEDEDFFSSMPEVNTQQITRNHLRHEMEQFDQEEAATQLAILDPKQENTDPKKVKLSDVDYSDAIHNSNQAEVKNIIELSKAFCFESAITMQKYVIQNCKAKNHFNDQEKCTEYNHKADLAIKNCEYIFPMETSYDEELHEKLMHSVSEHVVISSDGILYIGAGEEVITHNHFTPKVTTDEIINNEGHLMLAGEEGILPTPNELNLTNGD